MADPKKYYHATPYRNLGSILHQGLKRGCDGVVYLADSQEAALKFICIRCLLPILVIEVELDETEVEESFDHSFSFFKERAYVHNKDIPADKIKGLWKFG